MVEGTHREFEAALRAVGAVKLRLNQVVQVYHKTFPTDAMRPDMRQRLHDTLMVLIQSGAVRVDESEHHLSSDPLGLPQAIEMTSQT
jgi:hypothetical protein